jgi:hypothetical protein
MGINVASFADLRELAETLSAQQKLEIGNAIFTNTFLSPDITERHAVVTGVKTGDVVPIIDDSTDYRSFPFISQTSCESANCDLTVEFSGKKWTLGLIGCRYDICMKEFTPDFRTFFNENYQVLHNVDLNSQLLQYLTGKIQRNFNGAKYRVSYFADTTFPDGPDSAYFDQFDGFFTQAEAGDGLKIELNQANPTGEEMYDAFESAYASFMESDWSDKEGIRWKMTRKMAAAWVRFMNGLKDRSGYNCECFSADGLTAMRTYTLDGQITVLGIPVEVERDLDGVIKQFAMDRPYRALLTYRTNMPIATQLEENLNEFDIWYNKDTKKVIIEGEALIGSSLPTDEYIYIGAEVGNDEETPSV